MPNTNCLEGFRCPACDSTEPFRITVTTTVTFYDDGCDPLEVSGEMEWTPDSFCRCLACDRISTVSDFYPAPHDQE